MAEKPSEQSMHTPTWKGWVLIAAIGVFSVAAGYLAGWVTCFPYYKGFQGVFVQQPWPMALRTLAALAAAVAICMLVAISLTGRDGGRLGASIALLAGAGLVYRGGGMASVLQAADGRNIFWLMALELLVLGLLAWGCFAGRYVLGGARRVAVKQPFDWMTAGLQTVFFAGMMWLLAQSRVEAQGMWSVFFAGIAATMLTHFAIGRTWDGSWCIPIVVGIVGYIINALTAKGVDIANLSSPAASFGMATPLMYMAMGPIGLTLGELLHGEHHADEAAAQAT